MSDEKDREFVRLVVAQGKEEFTHKVNELYPKYRLEEFRVKDFGLVFFIGVLVHKMYKE